uniref:Death domain-containing protein n=1 Tax=Salmo trutta TaxID=8032 RepID=A0A674C2G3_SALTR
MFEMTRSGAIDMSKRDIVEERLQFFQIGPQSPCERTDLRMAIVADHLGLSWTELAREMDFSVDEINHIRVDNPNSLTAQSFMLLKKWVSRDGKNATTDSLTEVLTKINRMDIVTLLEGPIFDYGWHSETSSVNVEPPTPGRSLSAEGNDLQDTSPVNSLDSLTISPVRPAEKSNGDHADFLSQPGSLPEAQASSNGVKGHGQVEDEGRASASQGGQEEERGVQRSQHKVQGEEARNIPVESVTEEQFTDEDGNIVTRKSGEGSGSKVKKKQVEKDQW